MNMYILAFLIGMVFPVIVGGIVVWFVFRGSPWVLAKSRLFGDMMQIFFGEDGISELRSMDEPVQGALTQDEELYGYDKEDRYLLDGKIPMLPIVGGCGKSPSVPAAYYADKVVHDRGAEDLEEAIEDDYKALTQDEDFVDKVQKLRNNHGMDNQQAVAAAYDEMGGDGLPEIEVAGESFNFNRFKKYMTSFCSPSAQYEVAQKQIAADVEKMRSGFFSGSGTKALIIIIIIVIIILIIAGVALAGGGGGSAAGGGGGAIPF